MDHKTREALKLLASTEKKSVSGTTREVYLHILTSGKPVGVREVWRGMHLSSPSLAQYHINKLLERKLIENTENGKYQANEEEQIGALRSFIILRGRLIPRLVFYGAIIAGILASYLILWPFKGDFRDLVVLVVGAFSALTFFFEAYQQHRSLVYP